MLVKPGHSYGSRFTGLSKVTRVTASKAVTASQIELFALVRPTLPFFLVDCKLK